jgi:hypothetical protein
MHSKTRQIIFFLLFSAGAGLSQTAHCGVGVTDTYCNHCLYDHYGYPCEHRYTLSLLEIPAKENPAALEPDKKTAIADPLQARFNKRMAVIGSAGFTNASKVRMEIVPGLAPKN